MSDRLLEAVARIARHEAGARTWAGVAVVTEVHRTVVPGDDHAVTVRMRDSGVEIPRVPVAVGALGLAVTPAVDDLVLVVFADGDAHAGVVVGRLYHRGLAPPPHADGQIVLRLPPGAAGPDIEALLDPATPEVTITVGTTTVTITGDTATIATGECEVLVDGRSPGAVSVSAGEASLKLDGAGGIVIEAATTLELKATEITLTGSAKVAVSGGVVELN